MERELRPLEALGSAIARVHAEAVEHRSAEEHAAARRMFVAAALRPRGRTRGTWLVRGAIAAGAAATLALGIWWLWPGAAGRAGGERAAVGDGTWLAAPARSSLPVTLPDGTRLELAPRSRVRVEETAAAAGTRIVLESGELHARMTPRPGARWRVAAGPFEILVTGTEFSVAWTPDDERFELRLLEGRVEVRGPLLTEGRAVRAGQTVRVYRRSHLEVTDERVASSGPVGPSVEPLQAAGSNSGPGQLPPFSMSPTPAPLGPPGAAAPQLPGQPVPALPGSPATPAPAPALALPAPGSDWQALAAERRYADALAIARAEGLEGLCRNLPAASLVRLADVARYAGDADAATQALQSVRDRFPGTTAATQAAFDYGRIVADVRGNALAATAWFETYLQETPDGPFAREALGRLIETYDRLGSTESARRTAEQYLRRFPAGPHAELARRLVGP